VFPPPVRAMLLGLLRLPPEERAQATSLLYRSGLAKQLSELLMDLEEHRAARTVVVGLLGMLRVERLVLRSPPW
jgi:hypothetical protein